jgi:signal transduction histidine kinase
MLLQGCAKRQVLKQDPTAQNGEINITDWDFQKDGILRLTGEWLYYPDELLIESLAKDKAIRSSGQINPVPNPKKLVIGKNASTGFGTHLLKIKGLRKKSYDMSILVNEVYSAYQLYIIPAKDLPSIDYSKLTPLLSSGTVGKTEKEAAPHLANKTAFLKPADTEEELLLILQVSNYNDYGPEKLYAQLKIGESSMLSEGYITNNFLNLFVFACFFCAGIYHLTIFMQLRNDSRSMWFGLFCLNWASWIIMQNSNKFGIHEWFIYDSHTYEIVRKLEYLVVGLAPLLFFNYFCTLYPKDIHRRVKHIYWFLCLCLLPLPLFGKASFYFPFIRYIHILFALGIIIVIGTTAVAVKRGRRFVLITVFGLTSFFGCVIYFLLASYFVSLPARNEVFISGFLLFIAVQAYMISHMFVISYFKAKYLSHNLQKEVAEQTEAIRTILDNVKTGFFLVNRKVLVQKGFTMSCNTVLGLDLKENSPLWDSLKLSERDQESFQMSIEQIFEDNLPEIASLANIPSRFTKGNRVFTIQGSVVRNLNNEVTAILFTVNDATELAAIEDENVINRRLLNILNYKEAFRSFVADTVIRIEFGKKQIKSGRQNIVRQSLHTIKGNAALFEMSDLVEFIHRVEDQKVVESSHLDQISQKLHSFLKANHEIIGLDLFSIHDEILQIKRSKVEDLGRSLYNLSSVEQTHKVYNDWYQSISAVPVATLLGPIERSAKIMATQLGKHIDFEIKGGETQIDSLKYADVIHNLIHLIRNAIDHGIESPSERGTKDQKGKIVLSFCENNSFIQIKVQDDGRGINLIHLLKNAVKKGIIETKKAMNLTRDQLLDLIYVDKMTTTEGDEDNKISGRGMGMSSIKDAIQKMNGTITVDSSEGFGTTFTIELPK